MLLLIGRQPNLEAIIWCSGFRQLSRFEHGGLELCRYFAKLELSRPKVCLGLEQRAVSNLYKKEQILISHLSSIVVEGSAYPTPSLSGGPHR